MRDWERLGETGRDGERREGGRDASEPVCVTQPSEPGLPYGLWQGTKDLHLALSQTVLLLAFNDHSSLTFKQLQEITALGQLPRLTAFAHNPC